MKLWKARSATYKTHFFSAFTRCMFTNSCWIFATSLFVKTVGSKGYSQLFFFASLAALLYYLYFAFRGHKDSEPYNVYRAVLILAFVASLACFLELFSTSLRAYDDLLLYFFVVTVMTVDLVGTTLGPMVLQASVNPVIFRQVYQKIVATELAARITASGVVFALSQSRQLNLIYPFAWILLATHFFLFGVTVWRMRVLQIKPLALAGTARGVETTASSLNSQAATAQSPALKTVATSLGFIFKNPLVRIAMSVMVWSTATKFVLENLFYQVADKTFTSAPQLASFISALTIVIYALSLCLHPLITRLLNARLQLASLLSIQPLNILAFAALALLLPPFWPLVLLMVTYNIIHRSIQMPMSRQCLVPIPGDRRGTIVSLISILIALSTMATSGLMALMKNALHFEDYVVTLLVLGASILFMITSLDSYYIRNLWSLFQEVRSGQWREHQQQFDGLSIVALNENAASNRTAEESTQDGADIQSHSVLKVYASSQNRTRLAEATKEHLRLLSSDRTEERLAGLEICFVGNFPWFREPLAEALLSDVEAIKTFAENAARINREMPQLSHYTATFRRRVKTLALDLMQRNDETSFRALKDLCETTNHAAAESLIICLTDSTFKSHRSMLFECVSKNGNEVSIKPIVTRMYQQRFINATSYREILDTLPFGKSSNELALLVKNKLDLLKRDQLSFSENRSLDTFMHTLFLEEYRLSAGSIDKTLLESISEFAVLSNEESGILIDMHLSFLKRSDFFETWQAIMSVMERSAPR